MTWNRPIAAIVALAAGGLIYYLVAGNNSAKIPDGIAYGNGRIEAVQIDVSTKIPGRVSEVLAREGDLVKPGQVVAKIDTAQLRAQLARANAEIASAESQVAAAVAAVAQTQAQLVLANQALKRASELVEKGHTSRETYDTTVSNRDVATANVAAAKATLLARQRGVDATKAAAQEIQTQIDDATLTSPTIGRVLYRLAEKGEVLGSGGKVLTLVDLADVYMEIFLPAEQAARVAIGAESRIKLDVTDFAIPAKVSFVSPQSQFTPKQVETEVERAKLMFRVKVRIPEQLVLAHIEKVKTGIRGVAYVRLSGTANPPWPDFLRKLPPGVAPGKSTATGKIN